MCVPQEKLRGKVVVCGNCKSEKVSTRWVYRYGESEPKSVSMVDEIGTLTPPSYMDHYNIVDCGDCSATSIPIQVVMQCDECGFTVVRQIE